MDWSKFREQLDKFKIPLALSLVGVVLIIGGMISSNLTSAKSQPKQFPKESLVQPSKQIGVDISGAVVNPGVYKLSDGERVEEAIKSAGGFAKNVNREYVSKSLNMAQKISDGMKIYVPSQGEVSGSVISGSVAGVSANSNSGSAGLGIPVNINNASQSDLEALPGIGPVTAAKIISGRPYSKIEDLQNQKIISKSVFEKIKDSLVL